MELGTLGQIEASIWPCSSPLGYTSYVSLTACVIKQGLGGCLWDWHRKPTQPQVAKSSPILFLAKKHFLFSCVYLCFLLPSSHLLYLWPSVFLTAGYENYGYGYGYGQDNATNYGYGMATSHSWEMANSDTNANPSASGSASADSVLSRINQRLDMMPHLETDMIQGGVYGSGGERWVWVLLGAKALQGWHCLLEPFLNTPRCLLCLLALCFPDSVLLMRSVVLPFSDLSSSLLTPYFHLLFVQGDSRPQLSWLDYTHRITPQEQSI